MLGEGQLDAGAEGPSVPADAGRGGSARPRGPLAQMRIRKKLLLLHTLFSLGLAGILIVALQPALGEIIRKAEAAHARGLLVQIAADPWLAGEDGSIAAEPDSRVVAGTAEDLGLSEVFAAGVALREGAPETAPGPASEPTLVAMHAPGTRIAERFGGPWVGVSVVLAESRAAVGRLYALLIVALLIVYALVVVALEVFVLPRHVYGPIRSMLEADRAVRDGDRGGELIPDRLIPRDELGAIMRSRNESVSLLRETESALGRAFGQIEEAAADLRAKNHLLERARQNLAESDRLASLGMMSAGVAHELNTPLAVLKGLVERMLSQQEPSLSRSDAELMHRVVGRLERLSESLLDVARARAPVGARVELRQTLDEAITLVRMDREPEGIEIVLEACGEIAIAGDADRLVQVFVNLIRNAVDALEAGDRGRIVIAAEPIERDGARWAQVRIEDDGPGIEPAVLAHLFEPFVSTRMDARGTGLGLAVSEGIVREHGGVILAKNRTDARGGRTGAVFEVLLPRGPYVDGPIESGSIEDKSIESVTKDETA